MLYYQTNHQHAIMTAYICGPMRDYPRFNFDAFDAAAADLRGRGMVVISPADIDREIGFDPDEHDESFFEPLELIRRDVAAVLKSDCVVVLPGWDRSIGACAEAAIARWANKPVMEYPGMDLL